MNNSIYSPSEDSFLIEKNLKKEIPKLLMKNKDLKFLEIGAGSGIILKTALNSKIKKENIFATDINKSAVEHCKKLGFNCIYSNLFEKIPRQKFDLVVFNPPYLPEDKNEPKSSRMITTGGKKGNELTIEFLKQAKSHLNKNSKVFTITSSLAKNIDFKKLKYKSKKLDTKKLFFEELILWELNI